MSNLATKIKRLAMLDQIDVFAARLAKGYSGMSCDTKRQALDIASELTKLKIALRSDQTAVK